MVFLITARRWSNREGDSFALLAGRRVVRASRGELFASLAVKATRSRVWSPSFPRASRPPGFIFSQVVLSTAILELEGGERALSLRLSPPITPPPILLFTDEQDDQDSDGFHFCCDDSDRQTGRILPAGGSTCWCLGCDSDHRSILKSDSRFAIIQPYYSFIQASFGVDFASPNGPHPPVSQQSVDVRTKPP